MYIVIDYIHPWYCFDLAENVIFLFNGLTFLHLSDEELQLKAILSYFIVTSTISLNCFLSTIYNIFLTIHNIKAFFLIVEKIHQYCNSYKKEDVV